jgi:uncharacterized membrane protein YeaQ/YmgE (transglycosylase-associated protein family)
MKISPSSFAINPRILEEAKTKFAGGEPLILEVGGAHDEKAISPLLNSPNFQKDVVLGAGAGAATGMLVGFVVDEITRANPVAGIVGTLLLGIVGGVVGGAVGKEAGAVVHPTPAGKAATDQKLLPPAVKVTYDPQAGHLFAQLMKQTTK